MSALRKRVLTTKQDIGDSSIPRGNEDYAFIRSGYTEPKPLSGSEIMAKSTQKEADAVQNQQAPSVPSTLATKDGDAQVAMPMQDIEKHEPEMTVKDL